jgi:hypothetical protein
MKTGPNELSMVLTKIIFTANEDIHCQYRIAEAFTMHLSKKLLTTLPKNNCNKARPNLSFSRNWRDAYDCDATSYLYVFFPYSMVLH